MSTAFSRMSGMTGPQRSALTDQFDKAVRLAAAQPIAVVGVGCRFPGNVTGPQSYWDLLSDGRDAVTEVPSDRWDADAFYDPDPTVPGAMTSKWGGFLSDVAGFDADFFGITPREAEAMDPQQRLLLEVVWESLEHAGVPTESLGESRTAVMMGVYYNEYQSVSVASADNISAYCATGNAHSVTVGRIAYLLGLQGPAVAVDTACSSSLVAVHLACQSLRLRESDLALAGGVSLMLRPETQIALSSWGMFSPQGRCKTFDAGADGFVRGEGCGVVVLKRLSDAVRDGDRVLAVVRGSAVNQDGRSNGITAPNPAAQRKVITEALRAADVAAGTVNYVETHGTGTALGDPLEFVALAATYGRGEGACALGAVKTNLGHLEAAAGIAGFIKATLALQHGCIPGNLHFSRWNPAIDASSARFFVPSRTMPWPASPGPRRAGVSSFGFGGTNAHVVLEQGPDHGSAEHRGSAVTTLVVSGKTPERVSSWAGVLADWMAGAGADVPLGDVAHALNHHRTRHGLFATVCARDRGQAVAGLRAVAAGQPAPAVVGPHEGGCGPGTVFVYSGHGSQWAGMGRQLLADEPAFAAAVDELEPLFCAQVGFSLRQVLAGAEPVVGVERTQPVLVGMQLALTALWRSYGVEPDAVIGHSMGEVTAAVVAQALTPAEGLRVIAIRSQLMARLSGQGAMALLELDPHAAEALVAEHPDVTLAVYASPRQSVIAGPPEQINDLIATVTAQDRLARLIDAEVPFHHPLIDPLLPELRSALADLTPAAPVIPIITTTEDREGRPVFDAEHWAANLRNPVRLSQAVTAAAQSHTTFIEVSPHPILTHAITDTLDSVSPVGNVTVAATTNRGGDETLYFHTQLAMVRPPSAEMDSTTGHLAEIPPSPWQHSPFWVADRSAGRDLRNTHPLLGTHIEMPGGGSHVWETDIGLENNSWLVDHKVHGQPIMPAAAFAEIALATGSEALGLPVEAVYVKQLEVEQMLRVDSHTWITTQLVRTADNEIRVEVHSRSESGSWLRHAVARIDLAAQNIPAVRPDPAAESNGTELSAADFYAAMRHAGTHHGPAFAALTRIVRYPAGASETEIAVPDEAARHSHFRIHPVMLDAALQSLAVALPAESVAGVGEITYLPVSFESIRVLRDVGLHARCRTEILTLDEGAAGKLGRISLMDDAGNLTAEIAGVYLRRVESRMVPLPLTQKIFGTTWLENPIVADTIAAMKTVPNGSWLLLADHRNRKAADDFGTTLRSTGHRVHITNLADESAVRAAFAATAADPELPPLGVLVFFGDDTFDGTDADGATSRAADSIWSISTVVRAVIGSWHDRSPRLWLVTRRGLAVHDPEPGHPAIGALKGLIRVLAYEHPDLRATLVDVDTSPDGLTNLALEVEASGSDDVVAWRSGRRFVERLSRATLPTRAHAAVVRAEGSYIVTGGLGGLGLIVASWLVDRGGGRVVLNGRGTSSEEQQTVLAQLQGLADVVVVHGDIASPGVAEQLVAAAEATGLPLCGAVHAAAVIDDGLVVAMSKEGLDRVWAPKALGAMRLHEATATGQLDWWVAFSSAASLLGPPGQAAYACANAWLDAFAAWRRASGLPATVFNWGPWSDVGLARAMNFGVLDPITPAEGIEALESLLAGNAAQTAVARLRIDRALAAFPEIRQLGYFATVVEEVDKLGDGDCWPGLDALAQLEPAAALQVITERLRTRVLAIMGYPDSWSLDDDQPLIDLGMDSLMAVRIRNTTRVDFGVEPPVALLLQRASLRDVAGDLFAQLGLAGHDSAEDDDDFADRAHRRAAARLQAGHRPKREQPA